MRILIFLTVVIAASLPVIGQTNAQKIYETERAFEKMVAKQGIRAGFLEFLTSDSVMFFRKRLTAERLGKPVPRHPRH